MEIPGSLGRSVWRRRLAVALIAILDLVACSDPASREADPPNILLITIDTLRADHLSIYGYDKRSTPHIDALGRAGVVFESAHCDVTWTLPSMASSLTGTYPARHGIQSSGHRLSARSTTLAQYLGARGYHTRAVIGSFPLDSRYGLDRGFEIYDDDFPSVTGMADMAAARRSDDEVTAIAVGHLEDLEATGPFFLWVHYLGPHSIHDPNVDPGRAQRDHVNRYPDKVVATDAAVGNLLRSLEDLDLEYGTLVVLHADHGEALGERGWIGHGRYLYENVLRVPLILRWPAMFPGGRRVSHLVGNIDIVPTILQAVGEVVPKGELDGRSLFPAIFEDAPVRNELQIETLLPAHELFSESITLPDGRDARVGVVRSGILRPPFKYIRTEAHPLFVGESPVLSDEQRARVEREELYRLPREDGQHDLIEERDAERRALSSALSGYRDAAARPGPLHELSPGDESKLRTLGYVE